MLRSRAWLRLIPKRVEELTVLEDNEDIPSSGRDVDNNETSPTSIHML